jgi:hypothetical protein
MSDGDCVIRGKFISVHIPQFSMCSAESLRYTLCTETGIFSTLPIPSIDIQEDSEPTDYPIPLLPDPLVEEQLVADLESGIQNLSCISPLSISRKPSRPFRGFVHLQTGPPQVFALRPELEADPEFLRLREMLNSVRSIFR